MGIKSFAKEAEITNEKVPSALLSPFIESVFSYLRNDNSQEKLGPAAKVFFTALKASNINKNFIEKRFGRVNESLDLDKYRFLKVNSISNPLTESEIDKVAIHATKIDVIEEYDDFTNDNIYAYFIVTHGDQTWGRVTDTYEGLDQGTSFFFDASDRAIFGPSGKAMKLNNHVIIDLGIVESDGDDLTHLQMLSKIILAKAADAFKETSPMASKIADQLRAEVANLLKLISGLDYDDKLVTDSIYLTKDSLQNSLATQSYYEIMRSYEAKTFFTAYNYKITFRALLP